VQHPAQGDVVNVLFDPKSHKVKLGDEYSGSSRQADKQKTERFQAMAGAPPATPSAAGGGESSVTRISSAGSVTRIAP
jgi:hypothetical protein